MSKIYVYNNIYSNYTTNSFNKSMCVLSVALFNINWISSSIKKTLFSAFD